jgi:3alpha(or 20beta)-hydroxysteroid dehydrogenase
MRTTTVTQAFSKFELTGRRAVVTGGATGLGFYMTRGLVQSGARVLVAARREDVLIKAADELNAEFGSEQVVWRTVDLASAESIQRLADYALGDFGGVDIFVGNAAQEFKEPVDDIQDESIHQILQVNLTSNIQLFRHFLPGMRARQWGRVIFSSSAATICAPANDHMAMYTVTKAGLNAFTKVAANETGPDGITVNALILGLYRTEMLDEGLRGYEQSYGTAAAAALMDEYVAMTSVDRLGACEDVEGAVQLLASDAGSYITGAHIAIDGGLTSMLRPRVRA